MALIGITEIILALISFSFGYWLRNRHELIRNWPLVGMLPDLLANIYRLHDWLIDITERSGGTFHMKGPWFAGMDMMGTVDPANIKHILSINFSNYPKGHEFKEMFDIFGDGLFNSDADLWKNQRKTANFILNHDRFRTFLVKTVNSKVENGLIPVLEHVAKQGLVVDMQDLIHRFTLDIATILVTGYDRGVLSIEFPEDELALAIDYAEEVIFYRHVQPKMIWKLQSWLGFGKEKEMKKARQILDHTATKYITRKKEQLNRTPIILPEDLLTWHINNGEEMKFLRDTAINFLVAGRENSLTWFFWLVAKHPRVEAKIREEIKSVTPVKETADGLQLFDVEKLNNLFYLHGAFCETLRLYPPVMYEHKEPLQPDVLPTGHRVDPKMKIIFSSFVMGRSKSLWGDDCLEFKPERWISEVGRLMQQSPYKFLAFNAGPRICPGKEIALTEMKAAAAAVIHNYHIEVVDEYPVAPKCTSIVLHMKHGVMVRISRRSK